MNFAVTGIGWAGGCGAGRSGDSSSPGFTAVTYEALGKKEIYGSLDGRKGRLDPFSLLGLSAAAMALRDSGREGRGERLRAAMVARSVYGCLPTDAEFYATVKPQGGKLASPNLFAYTLPNCFFGEAAVRYGLCGPTMVLSGEDTLLAVDTAIDLMLSGDADFALCGVTDLPPHPDTGLPPLPMPGAIFLLIEPEGSANYARGIGILNDRAEMDGARPDTFLTLFESLLKKSHFGS